VVVLTARIGIDQLDAATRKRLNLPAKTASTRRTGSRKEIAGPGLPVVCWYCKEPCDGETAQTKHMAATGHRRFQALTG